MPRGHDKWKMFAFWWFCGLCIATWIGILKKNCSEIRHTNQLKCVKPWRGWTFLCTWITHDVRIDNEAQLGLTWTGCALFLSLLKTTVQFCWNRFVSDLWHLANCSGYDSTSLTREEVEVCEKKNKTGTWTVNGFIWIGLDCWKCAILYQEGKWICGLISVIILRVCAREDSIFI